MKIVSFEDQCSVSGDLWEKHPSDYPSLWGKVPILHQPGGNRDDMSHFNSMYTPQKSEMASTPQRKIYKRSGNGDASKISFKLLENRQPTPYPKMNLQSKMEPPSPYSFSQAKPNPNPPFASSSKAKTAGSLFSEHRPTPIFGSSGSLLSESEHQPIPLFDISSVIEATVPSSFSRSSTSCKPLFDASSVQGATFESIFAQSSTNPLLGSSSSKCASKIGTNKQLDSGFENSKIRTSKWIIASTPIQSPDGQTTKYEFATYPPMPAKPPCERSTPYPPLPEDFASPASESCNIKPIFSPTQFSAGQAKKEYKRTPHPSKHAKSTANTELSIPPIIAGNSSPFSFSFARNTMEMGTTAAEYSQSIFRGVSSSIPHSSSAWNSSFRDESITNPSETMIDVGELPFVLGVNENSDPVKSIFGNPAVKKNGEFSGVPTTDGKFRVVSIIKSPVQPIKNHKASNSPATKRILGDRMRKEKVVEGGNKRRNSVGAPMRPNISKPKQTKSFTSTKKVLRTEIRRRRTAEKDCEAKAETIKRQNELLQAQKDKIIELQAELKKVSASRDEDSDKKQAEKSKSKAKEAATLEDGTETKVVEPRSRRSTRLIQSPKKKDVVDSSQKTPRRSVRICKSVDTSGGKKDSRRKSHPMIRRSMTPKKK